MSCWFTENLSGHLQIFLFMLLWWVKTDNQRFNPNSFAGVYTFFIQFYCIFSEFSNLFMCRHGGHNWNEIVVSLQCVFSHGGHLFAAVNSTIISIYSSTTFESVSNLKGHNGKVRSVVWSADDSKLISCGIEGAVYEWDPYTGKRIGESVLKACSYSGVTVTPDGKSTYAVGSDKTIKEISDSSVSCSA